MNRPNWPRCEKCNSQNTMLVEVYSGGAYSWMPSDGRREGVCSYGDTTKVWVYCLDCGHEYKVDGIEEVDESWWEETVDNS